MKNTPESSIAANATIRRYMRTKERKTHWYGKRCENCGVISVVKSWTCECGTSLRQCTKHRAEYHEGKAENKERLKEQKRSTQRKKIGIGRKVFANKVRRLEKEKTQSKNQDWESSNGQEKKEEEQDEIQLRLLHQGKKPTMSVPVLAETEIEAAKKRAWPNKIIQAILVKEPTQIKSKGSDETSDETELVHKGAAEEKCNHAKKQRGDEENNDEGRDKKQKRNDQETVFIEIRSQGDAEQNTTNDGNEAQQHRHQQGQDARKKKRCSPPELQTSHGRRAR